MKFVKGVVIGGLITTGFVMMYAETGKMNKKMIKRECVKYSLFSYTLGEEDIWIIKYILNKHLIIMFI